MTGFKIGFAIQLQWRFWSVVYGLFIKMEQSTNDIYNKNIHKLLHSVKYYNGEAANSNSFLP